MHPRKIAPKTNPKPNLNPNPNRRAGGGGGGVFSFPRRGTIFWVLFKRIIKLTQELPAFGKFVPEVLIFRRSQFPKFQNVLWNFVIFTGKHLFSSLLVFLYKTPTVIASGFSQQQILFFSWIWYFLLTVASVFAPNSFENTS